MHALPDPLRPTAERLLGERLGLAEGWYTDDELGAVATAAAAAIEDAVRVARESPFPAPALLGELVYADA